MITMRDLINLRLIPYHKAMLDAFARGIADREMGIKQNSTVHGALLTSAWAAWYNEGYDDKPLREELKACGVSQDHVRFLVDRAKGEL